MEIIIEQGSIKRKIEGPFRICIGAEDRRNLIRSLMHDGDDFHYGWIDIVELPPDSEPNNPPLDWDA